MREDDGYLETQRVALPNQGLFTTYYYCTKFETSRDYSEAVCAEMKGR